MPKEETIELRHIRGVIGEKEDLPTYKQKSSSMSKLKSILLKLIGTPKQIHEFGTLAIDETLTLLAGENDVLSLYNDGTNLYIGINTSPGNLVKVDLDNYVRISSLSLGVDTSSVFSISSDGTNLYIGATNVATTIGKIIKINIASFTITSTLSFNLGETFPVSIVIFGNYIYVLLSSVGGGVSGVKRIDITTFTVTSLLTLIISDANSMTVEGRYLYVVSDSGNLDKIDIDTFTVVSTLALVSASRGLYSDGNYIYVGGSQILYKIDILTFTIITSITLNAGEYVTSIISDGIHLYLSSSGTQNIIIIDISSFTIIKRITFSDNVNSLTTDNLFIYIGLGTTPGTVQRKYILPTINSDSKKIDSIHKNNVATVTTGTYSHANNTNKQDVLEFTANTQDIELRLDMVNITQLTTITEEEKIDATNYRIITQKIFPSDFDTNTKAVAFSFPQSNQSYKVTFQSGTAEGSAKNVPYVYRLLQKD